jgi:hypothetical protein
MINIAPNSPVTVTDKPHTALFGLCKSGAHIDNPRYVSANIALLYYRAADSKGRLLQRAGGSNES